MSEIYRDLPEAVLDPIMQSNVQWAELQQVHDDPINTTVGVLLDPKTGKPWRPFSVQKALIDAKNVIDNQDDFGYQIQLGNEQLLTGLGGMAFSKELYDVLSDEGNLIGAQALGGTGALSLAKDILSDLIVSGSSPYDQPKLLLDGGWPNHQAIFGKDFSLMPFERTVDPEKNHESAMEFVDFGGGAVTLLQAAGYNDDGLDRTHEQWDEVFELLARQSSAVIIDAAYLGLADNLEADCYAIEQSVKQGLLTFVCISSSKNMGLYGERVGALFIANARATLGDQQASRLKQLAAGIIRRTYSNPPRLAATAVGALLRSEGRTVEYTGELAGAHDRLKSNRASLASRLGPEFRHVEIGKGLFTKLSQRGFKSSQMEGLRRAGILALPNSRLNLGGIKSEQIERVAAAILEVMSAKDTE